MNYEVVPLIHTNISKQNDTKFNTSCFTLFISTLIFLIVIIWVVFWVTLGPKWPIFAVEEGSIHGYNVTTNNHLNAGFNFVVSANNPNTNLSLYYELMEIKVYHGGQLVGYDGIRSFLQDNGNITSYSFGGLGFDMPLFESPGEVDLMLEINGKFWFNADSVNLVPFVFNAKCFPIVVYFDFAREFERTSCYLEVN